MYSRQNDAVQEIRSEKEGGPIFGGGHNSEALRYLNGCIHLTVCVSQLGHLAQVLTNNYIFPFTS